MKTDDLIGMLTASHEAVDRAWAQRRLLLALAAGGVVSLVLMRVALGVRGDFAVLAGVPMFWSKIAFVAALFAASVFAVRRLARPGARLAPLPGVVAAPFVALAILALAVLAQAAPETRSDLVLGQTWKSCASLIAMLSLPVLVAVGVALKDWAPTRPRLAGAAAGLLAGSTGALVYCLHCPEIAPPFIAIWYVAGIAVPTALGALAGERWLRW